MTPFEWHGKVLAAERAGRRDEARQILERALQDHPTSADLLNSAGNFAQRSGDYSSAEGYFARALALAPDNSEYAINRAIALTASNCAGDAIALLIDWENAAGKQPRYWSARGNAERLAGLVANAAASYDRCLALKADYPRALHGRARLALERGENDAPARFDRALAVSPGEADLWLGKAQALDAAGNPAAARTMMEQIVGHAPQWVEALRFLAQLRLAMGETDFTAPFADAAQRLPADSAIALAHIDTLAGLDYAQEARDIAAAAQQRFSDDPQFTLAEAVNAGAAGDDDRAEEIFAASHADDPQWNLHEARHRIRRGELDRAEQLLLPLTQSPDTAHSAYALLGVIWRLNHDERADWLHGQAGLVQKLELHAEEALLDEAIERLHHLHDGSPLPLGQSLRGGTQTRHILFHRHEPVFARLHKAIVTTLEEYRSNLPVQDTRHPLLKHRNDHWGIAGSWSVRLRGGGDFHTSHIHPMGLLSSALYLVVPDDLHSQEQQGYLEIGRPPADLRLDLGPMQVIQPERGYLALFPSTLYHGTTPFRGDTRMTVAFDVGTKIDKG